MMSTKDGILIVMQFLSHPFSVGIKQTANSIAATTAVKEISNGSRI